jgi:4-hydroxybenzoate polyprenyltransferase
MTIGSKVVGHIRLMRPYAWLWFDAVPLTIIFLLLDPEKTSPVRFLLALLSVLCTDSGITTLNDVYDVETDRASVEPGRNRRPIAAGIVTPGAAKAQVLVLFTLALLLASQVDLVYLGLIAGALAWGAAYSVPPLRLSARTWSSQPYWLLLLVIAYSVVARLALRVWTPSAILWLLATILFFAVGENAAKDLRDLENDTHAKKQTLIVSLGGSRGARLSQLGGVLGIAAYGVLLWIAPGLNVVARVVGGLWLLFGLWSIVRLTGQLSREYRKESARKLHVQYIRVYLWLNIMLIAGFYERLGRVFGE